MRVDRETLRLDYTETPPEDGLQARFYPTGDLAYLALYCEGQMTMELKVNPALGTGSLGKTEQFQPQLGLPSSTAHQLTDWTLAKVAEIEDAASEVLHCSFCTRHADEVSRLIQGPNLYICDECIRLCVAILSQDPED